MSRPSPSRAVEVAGLVNGRDLGGVPRRAGGVTPTGVFFRSEKIDRITPEGWEALRALGVRTVVDLRESRERARDVGGRPDWLTTVHVGIDGEENTEFWTPFWKDGSAGTAVYYLPHLAAMPERTGAALAALVNAREGGVLFHCAAGRDRTGLIAMLLLRIADAEPAEIVQDYLETVRRGPQRAAALGAIDNEPEIEERLAALGTSTERAFTDALEGLDLDAFLAASGLTEAELERLRTWRGALTNRRPPPPKSTQGP